MSFSEQNNERRLSGPLAPEDRARIRRIKEVWARRKKEEGGISDKKDVQSAPPENKEGRRSFGRFR